MNPDAYRRGTDGTRIPRHDVGLLDDRGIQRTRARVARIGYVAHAEHGEQHRTFS